MIKTLIAIGRIAGEKSKTRNSIKLSLHADIASPGTKPWFIITLFHYRDMGAGIRNGLYRNLINNLRNKILDKDAIVDSLPTDMIVRDIMHLASNDGENWKLAEFDEDGSGECWLGADETIEPYEVELFQDVITRLANNQSPINGALVMARFNDELDYILELYPEYKPQ